ncbi:glycosyltransferase family 8 protein [Billgrantia ethanolica]|uniref:Glycosyltransferase family 8 protein n=1 Tax=Billgrantia ethanolica TaxID=2733486 RepID=A0ABS9A037_9GAMM|nr:glycosyltransferase family 8 protein [Halomonas ethanolica]MCE8002204.1 glycosyltransferase family 8 protein [Halomonas ethanolica]
MELLLCADERYAPYAATTMVSALEHMAEPGSARVTLLTPGLPPEIQGAFSRLAEQYGATARVVEVGKLDIDPAHLDRFGKASLLPLFMHEHFDRECSRVIYLDCDMAVLADLAPLWEVPLGEHVIAAVRDIAGDPDEHSGIETAAYFNSGLLVVDLERWREHDVAGRAWEYLQRQGERLRYPDQDALNHVLAGLWYELEPRWNLQSATYAALNVEPKHLTCLLPALADALREPGIIHYTGNVKPWHAESEHPLRDVFRHYSCLTPWPLREKVLLRSLPWRQRLRLVMKSNKIRKRRKKTRWMPNTDLGKTGEKG